jgi:GNAT superfamily N-acetyltransferase
MPVHCRPASKDDAPAIAALHARSWRATYRGAYRDEYLDGELESERLGVWTQRLSDPPPNQFVVVAEDAGNIVGFACVYGDFDEAGSFLDNIHADPDRHGEGIGGHLLREVVAWCRAHHPQTGLHLKVFERNVRARRFYERFGAIDRGRTEASSPYILETAHVRSYAWPTLDHVSDA